MSVHFGLIRSYSINFSPIRSTSVHSVHFGLIWSYSVHFGLIWFYSNFSLIWSTLVLFGPIQLTSFLFGLLRSYLVHYIHFGLIRAYYIHFDSIRSYRSNLVLYSPLWSNLVHFSFIQSTLIFIFLDGKIWIHFDPIQYMLQGIICINFDLTFYNWIISQHSIWRLGAYYFKEIEITIYVNLDIELCETINKSRWAYKRDFN